MTFLFLSNMLTYLCMQTIPPLTVVVTQLYRLQSALNKASTWFAHNRLVVNTNKSSLMLISHFENPLETLNISLNGEFLDCIPSSQLLGLNILVMT